MFLGKIWSELLSLSMRDLFVLLARNSNLDNEHFKMVKYFKQDKKKKGSQYLALIFIITPMVILLQQTLSLLLV